MSNKSRAPWRSLVTATRVGCSARTSWPYAGTLNTSAVLAGWFAAKEAAIKVLRPGARGLDWRSIEVRRELTGKVTVQLSGTASELPREAGITRIEVSLSCSAGRAMAVALASHGESPPASRTMPESER